MTIKKGWHFSSSDGFTGSAGRQPVKGYMRGGAVRSAPVSRMARFAEGGHWIEGATKNKGALHRALGVPEGKKIPAGKMKKAEHSSSGKVRREAALAKTLKGMHKHARGGQVKGYRIGGLATGEEYAVPSRETVRPGGAQQFAKGGMMRKSRSMMGRKNDAGLPKLAPANFPPSTERGNEVTPGGRLKYAKGGMSTLGKEYDTPGKGKWADYKRGGKMKRGGHMKKHARGGMHKDDERKGGMRGGGRC